MGVLDKNEVKVSECAAIMDHHMKYVTEFKDEPVEIVFWEMVYLVKELKMHRGSDRREATDGESCQVLFLQLLTGTAEYY